MEDAERRPHFRDLVTTISDMLEHTAGYLNLKRSFSLITNFKKSHSPEERENEEEGEENGEQLEGGEGAEEAVQ